MQFTKEIYISLVGRNVRVTCVDGQVFTGVLSEWFSAEDNNWDEDAEPRGESVLIDTAEGAPTEIYLEEINRIEAA